jgi:N-acyl-D-amino-acid deacylase
MIEEARAHGLDATADQYPYTASSTTINVLLPSWAHEGGGDELRKRLADPPTRAKIAAEMKDVIGRRAGRTRLDYAVVSSCKWDRSLDGLSVAEINRRWQRRPLLDDEIQTVLDLVARGGAHMVYHGIDERDVGRILQSPLVMVASDGGITQMGTGVPHPRAYGTHARVLGRYVRDLGLIRLEEAVRKMTSLPAQRFGLRDRGLVRPGAWADLVVFDERAISDAATFDRPHAYSRGFRLVLVNGQPVIADGKHTGARPGQVLLGPGADRHDDGDATD